MKIFAVIMWLLAFGCVLLVDFYLNGEITNLGRGGIIVLIVLAFLGRALQKFVNRWRRPEPALQIRIGNKIFKFGNKKRTQDD